MWLNFAGKASRIFPMSFTTNGMVNDYFMSPSDDLLRNYIRSRSDLQGGLSDERFIRLGITRALEGDESGRAFLQSLADQPGVAAVPRSTWIDAFQSSRRLKLLIEVATTSYRRFERELAGRHWLECFPELSDVPVWAVDGHHIEHACHAPKDRKDEHVSSGMTYGLCLHTGLLRPLARFQGDGLRQHEWPVFKDNWQRWTRDEHRPGMPVVVVDPAYIDCQYWVMQKIRRQAMVITREKENMKPVVYSRIGFDRDDPVNRGVEAYEYVGYSNAALRRVLYKDPATGEAFVFITTCPAQMRPGLIALLYFLRWKIEKAYDVFKNKFISLKAWGVGDTAATMQAHFMTLLHNLLTVLLARMESIGLYDQKILDRTAKRREHTPLHTRVPAQEMVHHAHALSCQFIQLVKHCFRFKIPWSHALPLFKLRLHSYL
jgi:hypothetical protein